MVDTALYYTVSGCLKCSAYYKRPQSLTRESPDSRDEIIDNTYHLVMSHSIPVASIGTTGRISERVDHH